MRRIMLSQSIVAALIKAKITRRGKLIKAAKIQAKQQHE